MYTVHIDVLNQIEEILQMYTTLVYMCVQVFWRTHEKSTVQVHANNIKCNTCNLIVGKLVTGQGLNNFLSPAMRGVQTQVVPLCC